MDRRIYWTDWTDQSIEYAYENGSKRKKMVHSLRPTGLTIDHAAERLYFTDMRQFTIESVTLDGKDRKVVYLFKSGMFGLPFSLHLHLC